MVFRNGIWLLAGALVGLLLLGGLGAIVGAVCGFLIGRVQQLGEDLESLRQRMEVTASGLKARVSELEERLRTDTDTGAAASPDRTEDASFQDIAGPASAESTAVAADAGAEAGAGTPFRVVEEVDVEAVPDDPWGPPRPLGAAGGGAALRRFVGWFTEGNPVVRVGMVVLFFGVSFLVKYAAEHNIVPIELRLAGVSLAAVAVLVTGWKLRERPGAYGLVLQGGAVAVLYLTVFASVKLYHLLPSVLAFALMVALVALAGVLAVLQDARALALFGAAGGFVTPILLSSGGGNHMLLFSYYALLNAGILGIAWFKSWRELNVLGFVFTFVIGATWGHHSYRPEYFVTTEPFLVLFFLFYLAIAVLFAHRQPPQLRGYIDGSLVFGVPLVGIALQAALVKDMEYGLAFSALVLSALYILLARALWKRRADGMRMLTEAFLALGVVFASLAVPLALDGRWTAAVWALEGAALVWVGVHQQRRLARWFGLLLQLGAGSAFVLSLTPVKASYAVWNGAFLGGLVVSLAALFSSWQLQRHRDRLMAFEVALALPVMGWGLLWWCGIGLREIGLWLTGRYEPAAVLGFAAFSAWLA
ncbi:MAG: DUF2339 domain-containing protein, partial [Gammaproteobacteria bacterium]